MNEQQLIRQQYPGGIPGRHGAHRPRAGRILREHRPVVHRATTAGLQAAYPFLAEGGLGAPGVYIGRDRFGGSFTYDPWELYKAKLLTNPNIVIVGHVGSGKSSIAKSLLWRSQVFGRHATVVDPKGEYDDLARACGTQPIRLGPGRSTRVNPFDPGPGADELDPREVAQRQLSLLLALAGTALDRPLQPVEYHALRLALESVSGATYDSPPAAEPEQLTVTAPARRVPTLPQVIDALLSPTGKAASRVQLDRTRLADESRDVALVMLRMVEGDLAGMFDSESTVEADFSAPLVTLNLSDIYTGNPAALPLVMTCAMAWMTQALTRPGAARRYQVFDEAWALLRSPATARWMQGTYKLARAYGVANVAITQAFTDLGAVGDAGSEVVALARGLVNDSGTHIVYHQDAEEAAVARTVLGLNRTETELVTRLGQGVGLWRIGGQRSFLVQHRRSRIEQELTGTDASMHGQAPAAPTPEVVSYGFVGTNPHRPGGTDSGVDSLLGDSYGFVGSEPCRADSSAA